MNLIKCEICDGSGSVYNICQSRYIYCPMCGGIGYKDYTDEELNKKIHSELYSTEEVRKMGEQEFWNLWAHLSDLQSKWRIRNEINK